MKVIVDTNIFLDFYNTGKDKLIILEELIKNTSNIILPTQVYYEFRRNRISMLDNILDGINKNFKFPGIPGYPLIRELDDFKELTHMKSMFDAKKKALLMSIEEMKSDPSKDPIFCAMKTLVESANVEKIESTEEIIEKARRRQLLGHPPRNTKKVNVFSACDEIIWETILANVKSDIIVTTRDSTYADNFDLLNEEFSRHTMKTIRFASTINSALEILGKPSSPEIVKLENEQVEELSTRATESDTPQNFFEDHEGRPFCFTCGSYGPWNGIKCLNCGRMRDNT